MYSYKCGNGTSTILKQTNNWLAGGIVMLGESLLPLPMLHRQKSPRLVAQGNTNRTCGVGMHKTFGNISRSRDAQNAALAWW